MTKNPKQLPTANNSSSSSTIGYEDDAGVWAQIKAEAHRDTESEPALASYLYSTTLSHSSLERSLSFHLSNKLCSSMLLSTLLYDLFLNAFTSDPSLHSAAIADFHAARECDPACICFSHCLLNYKGFLACQLEKLVSKESLHYEIICFNYYVQFHLHLQLSEAAEYARKKGVVLKGDLPIGVDRNSVDTWVYPNLFRMNTSTGAPPDYFDKNGQNWGFPTYNWEEMSKDNYAWWRARLTQMAKYFTAYRIDHILGFFRIWELPDHVVTGLVGKF